MFTKKREELTRKLKAIKEQISVVELELKSRMLKKGEASEIMTRLNAQRAEIEKQLLDMIVETEDSFQHEAWDGFKKGLVASIKSLETMLDKSAEHHKGEVKERILAVEKEQEVKREKHNIFNSFYAKLAAKPYLGWLTTAFLVYMLLIAVDCLAGGFKVVSGGPEGVKQLFAFASNPFAGLVVGILATALIQSSSTTTSIIVGLCAAGLPVASAIPMIMGANVGTSVTNTLVSMGHLGHKNEFKRAFAAATVHDFFNLLAVIIFLPLELFFGILQKSSYYVAQHLTGAGGFDIEKYNFIKTVTKPVSSFIAGLFKMIPGGNYVSGGIFIVFGIALVFFSILMLGKLLRLMLIGRAEKIFKKAVGSGPVSGIAAGMLITVLVQSSSTTTSLTVPLAGAGVMKLRQVYPFTLGANIGTCITALIAALAIQTGAEFALQIAFVHLFFNVFAVVLIYGIPFLRRIPMRLAQNLSNIAKKKKILALAYVAGVFFILPLLFLGCSKLIDGGGNDVAVNQLIQNNIMDDKSDNSDTPDGTTVCPTCGSQTPAVKK